MSEIKYKYKSEVMDMFITSHNDVADIVMIYLKGIDKPLISFYRKEDMDDWMHKGLVPAFLDHKDQEKVEAALLHFVQYVDVPKVLQGVNLDLLKNLHTKNGRHFRINKDDILKISKYL